MRKRGRPPLRDGESSTPVNVRLNATDFDRAHTFAKEKRTSLPDVMRRALARYLLNREKP